MFDKKGVLAKRRLGDNICVRGESTFPFNIADVFKVILDPESLKEIDPQLDTVDTLEKFSPHTWLDCLKFKPVMHGGFECVYLSVSVLCLLYKYCLGRN